jgi:hypothetical protein
MRDHTDHTAEMAIGNVNTEWKQMARLAIKIREGRCKPSYVDEQSKLFVGIYKRLLTDPIDEVKREAS